MGPCQLLGVWWWRSSPMTTPSAPSRRLSSAGALLHPWLQQPQPSSTKALSKERIKQFLTRRKWQVPGGGDEDVEMGLGKVGLSAAPLLSRKQAKPCWPSTG